MGGSCGSRRSLPKDDDDMEGLLGASSGGEKEMERSEHKNNHLPTITLAELKYDFSAEPLLGEGRIGRVYKGELKAANKTVAIRKLNPMGPQRQDEFLSEAKLLSKLDHPNIVKVLGFCMEGEQNLIIYEYMPLGSLESNLHRNSSDMKPLDWNRRKEIALCTAKGLKYLHIDQDPPIIHRNLKSSNVLLEEGYKAKLSDIGMAVNGKFISMPEYPEMGKLTVESDIYAFGLLLLEIITGKRATGDASTSSSSKPQNLVAWADPFLKDKERTMQIADLSMGDLEESEFHKTAYLAAQCLQEDANRRPHIDEIISNLSYACPWEKQHADEISGGRSRRSSSAK